jgi:murein L,D-transpeptidase YcbB/YkuD
MAPLAAPGTSQHNSGLAVDVHTASGPRLQWMIANCAKFGWSWEVVPEEPWHIRYTEGDNVPEAVKAWMAANPSEVCVAGATAAPAAQPAPKPAVTSAVPQSSGEEQVKRGKANAASNPILQLGSKGSAVRTLQQLLNKAGVKCATDGDFGANTEIAVKNFQSKVGIESTGVVNHKTWAKINP